MSGIAGFCGFEGSYQDAREKYTEILTNMRDTLRRRGPDDEGAFLDNYCGLGHTHLSVVDPAAGHQPLVKQMNGKTYAISYNGGLYNASELRSDLIAEGAAFKTKADAEVILTGYAIHGADYVKALNGVFAFAVWDGVRLFLVRDRAGIKPLFYTVWGKTLVFGSEIKALFQFPGIRPVIDRDGLCEILAIGPARTAGSGVFKGIREIRPGCFGFFSRDGLREMQYWDVTAAPHTDSHARTVEKVGFLVTDAIRRQMVSDAPICSFLSGGVDSSVVTAVAASRLKEKGETLDTYSFDFVGNDEFFQANDFQPDRDRPWVDKMVGYCQTNHRYLECGVTEMTDLLYDAVDARDLPGMADVDSSLLYFCEKVSERHKVALTGECADEIFGGYPWFHSREAFNTRAFPWSRQMENRTALLSAELLNELDLNSHAQMRYEDALAAVPSLPGESREESRRREIAYLNLRWFMATLIDRMDRVSMYAGLEARVPFADHRIIEYVFNIPWEMKCKDGVVKDLLRRSATGLLPDEILYRKKSPFPKTYNPAYEGRLRERLSEVLSDVRSPLLPLIDVKKVEMFMAAPGDYGKPWFGQLMAGPQMMAYLLQINYWLKKYKIEVV